MTGLKHNNTATNHVVRPKCPARMPSYSKTAIATIAVRVLDVLYLLGLATYFTLDQTRQLRIANVWCKYRLSSWEVRHHQDINAQEDQLYSDHIYKMAIQDKDNEAAQELNKLRERPVRQRVALIANKKIELSQLTEDANQIIATFQQARNQQAQAQKELWSTKIQ